MTGVPAIDQSLLPAEIRNGSAADRKTYSAAVGFERALLGELTKVMADTAKPVDGSDATDSGSDDGGKLDSSTSTYMDMLPDQLADGLQQNGGLGLAKTFYDSMKERGQ
jgi:Rod binding domain-containing protein